MTEIEKIKEIIATEINVCKEVFRSDINLPTMIYVELERNGFFTSLQQPETQVGDSEIEKIGARWCTANGTKGRGSAFKAGFDYAILMRSKLAPEQWVSAEERLPKLRTYLDEKSKSLRQEVSKEVIVTDGLSSWAESFSEDFKFHETITHWMNLPTPPPNK